MTALRVLNVVTIVIAVGLIISIVISFVDNTPGTFVDFMVRLYILAFALGEWGR